VVGQVQLGGGQEQRLRDLRHPAGLVQQRGEELVVAGVEAVDAAGLGQHAQRWHCPHRRWPQPRDPVVEQEPFPVIPAQPRRHRDSPDVRGPSLVVVAAAAGGPQHAVEGPGEQVLVAAVVHPR